MWGGPLGLHCRFRSDESCTLDFQDFQDWTSRLDFWTSRLDFWTSRLDFLDFLASWGDFWGHLGSKFGKKSILDWAFALSGKSKISLTIFQWFFVSFSCLSSFCILWESASGYVFYGVFCTSTLWDGSVSGAIFASILDGFASHFWCNF